MSRAISTCVMVMSIAALASPARLAAGEEQKDKHVVGTNPEPSVYEINRERNGEDAFKPNSGSTFINCSGRLLGRDGFYIGHVGQPATIGVKIVNAHIYDAGRQGLAAVNSEDVEVIGGVWGDGAGLAHDVVDLEPLLPAERVKSGPGDHVRNFTFRGESRDKPLLVGKAGYFLIGSKGDPRCKVSDILIQDVVSLPGTAMANAAWFAGSEQFVKGPVTFRRVSVNVSHSISDTARIEPPVKSGRDKAFFFAWCDVTLEDCWVNGKPLTNDDVQWVGREPVIRFTDWKPPKVSAPGGEPEPKNAEPATTWPYGFGKKKKDK